MPHISKTQQRMMELAEKFAEGHPDGVRVSTVRNYGGIGREDTAVSQVIIEKGEVAASKLEVNSDEKAGSKS